MPNSYYRFEANVIGRSSGKQSSRSVVFAAAYRAGERLEFEREGVTADYASRVGVLETGILTPDTAPDWARDRGTLWNRVEAVEKRRDAQLARELQLAFPSQFSPEQRSEALAEFLSAEVTSLGMIADYAIHAPSRRGDGRNHHAHVLLTMRHLDENGFGNKCREWNSPELLRSWREGWANTLNRCFERHQITDANGEAYRADHRNYEDRALELEPGVHLGPAVTALERRGIQTDRGDINREVYARNGEISLLKRQAEQINAEVLRLQLGHRIERKGLRFSEGSEKERAISSESELGFFP